jgi:uncharacterized glyoxalase superfamily protein PhnB
VERAIPILPSDDPDVAKRFYVDGLGFSVAFQASYPHASGEGCIIGLERGSLRIHLDSPMPGHGRHACLLLEVDDADDRYEEWVSTVEIRRPPEDQAWGAPTFDVIDPFGNTLFVVGPMVRRRSAVHDSV